MNDLGFYIINRYSPKLEPLSHNQWIKYCLFCCKYTMRCSPLGALHEKAVLGKTMRGVFSSDFEQLTL